MSDYKIYVASLSDYNAGILHGKWIELEGLSTDDIQDEVNDILKSSPYSKETGEEAEEWAIHDYELGGIRISEYEGFDTIVQIVEALEEHGEALAAYYNHIGGDIESAVDGFEEAYCGDFSDEHDPMKAYAEQFFDEVYLHEVPEHLRFYIDYELFARDLFMQDYFEEDGHVFRSI